MKAVYKYDVLVEQVFLLIMPKGAVILSCQTQFNAPKLWAIVDTETEMEQRYFRIYGTGQAIPDEELTRLSFISTFQLYEGNYVYHLFEYTP